MTMLGESIDQLIQRIKDNPNQGARCTWCTATANACKVVFLERNQVEWCCDMCALYGPERMHTNIGEEE